MLGAATVIIVVLMAVEPKNNFSKSIMSWLHQPDDNDDEYLARCMAIDRTFMFHA